MRGSWTAFLRASRLKRKRVREKLLWPSRLRKRVGAVRQRRQPWRRFEGGRAEGKRAILHPWHWARKAAFTVLTVLLAYLASLFGFGSLIGTIYPLFGYASAVFLVLMLLHALRLRKAA